MKRNFETMSAPLHMLLAAVLTAFLFYLSNTTLPLLSLFMVFPFVTLYVTEGLGWLLGAAALSGGIIALAMGMMGFTDPMMGVDLALGVIPQTALMAAAMGELIRRKRPTFEEFVIPALVFTAASAAYLFMNAALQDGGFMGRVQDVVNAVIDELTNRMREEGFMNAQIVEYEVFTRSLARTMITLTPSFFFTEGVIAAIMSSSLSRWFLHNTVSEDIAPLRFESFYVTRSVATGLVLSTVVTLLLGSWLAPLQAIGLNLLSGGLLVFFIHGMARVQESLKRHGMGLALRILVGLVIVVFLVPTLFVTFYGIYKGLQIKEAPAMAPTEASSEAADEHGPSEDAE
ncbi:MAG: DUF2232 domain-containing protein [Peptoniphilaceae bacterium]|nr:DUF2232 domain-containing protein [Peptoniphilaceae bacterium]MDY6085757.1 DUF2232 domain-containing protein [Peptoniphilaceae bacterium]